MVSPVKVKKISEVEVPKLGENIKKLRKESDKTVEELAKIAGISRAHWYEVEKENFRDGLPYETLLGIEKALNTDFGVKFDD